ncbi:hypothetical protein LTR84_003545 [Exophiala bonariae]|uniref:Zn(2)-C6 fungal-type domain-containing protein n=1 Tax=Exophiala bonariae TaxID=1690606 RepID=A0AAV9NB19_9EURO|nr:hypothetical protein LTR84_003545 [Exophiala bonariae]
MGRKPRKSGYSSRDKHYRELVAIANGTNQYPTGSVPHRPALPLVPSQPIRPQQRDLSAQSNPQRQSVDWPISPPTLPNPVDSLAVASYHQSNFANSTTTSPTDQLGYERRTSPEANTPTNSTVISDAGCGQFSRIHGGNAITSPQNLFSSITDDVVGIDKRYSAADTTRLVQQLEPKFIPPHNQLPSNYPKSRRNNEPWTPVQYQPPTKSSSMDTDMHDVPDHTHSQDGREKGGGRIGPLSQIQRQQASEVRRKGACLRCQIMREKCDLKIPCHTCETKDRRKFPKKCIRANFDWESQSHMYFPDELTHRLKQDKLFTYLSFTSFSMSNRPEFTVKLDLHIEDKLWVVVKEFTPLEDPIRHAHRSINDASGNKSYQRLQVWSPPIIMRIRDGELPSTVTTMRKNLRNLFTTILADEGKWARWSTRYFYHVEEDFQCDLVIWIGKYYRKDIDEHSILATALSLLWWEYLLLNKITVAEDDLVSLDQHLGEKRPKECEGMPAVPETINRFLKAIILPMAIETAKKLTEAMHDRLFKMAVSQKLSQSGTDIATCLMFVLMIFMGGIQSTLLLLPDMPGDEIGIPDYSLESAKSRILEIEETIIELWTSFHRYTLSRRGGGTSAKSMLSAKEVNSPAEVHAREHNLVGKMKKGIEDDYGTCLPPALDVAALLLSYRPGRRQLQMQQQLLVKEQMRYRFEADWFPLSVKERPLDLTMSTNHGYVLDGFRATNISRLCWRVWANIETGAF